ncbi:MAG: ABC transporter ATP-binding protein [Bacteroidetes bacterium]|nr:ABC transporter ATP-binding protein [Bacteroidota bacterium]
MNEAELAARVRNVTKTYRVGNLSVPAVRAVDLDIEKGAFLSLAGPSGSGKTTLLNLLGALDTATSGDIWIGGHSINGLSNKELADFRNTNLGFVFQTFNLVPVLTVIENAELPLQLRGMTDRDERRDKVEKILVEVGLGDLLDRRPNELSGGQQQRVAIARALVKNPTIVLADEPTANLDSETAREIMVLMQAMNEKFGTTFVFSTHDPLVMEYATRLVLLRDGKIESDERTEPVQNAI